MDDRQWASRCRLAVDVGQSATRDVSHDGRSAPAVEAIVVDARGFARRYSCQPQANARTRAVPLVSALPAGHLST
jgi:hypothetical protein